MLLSSRSAIVCVALVATACAGGTQPGAPTDTTTTSTSTTTPSNGDPPEPPQTAASSDDTTTSTSGDPIAGQGVVLRISVFDETSDWSAGTSGLPNLEIWVPGTGSWFPDTSFGGDVLEDAGPFPVGETTEIFIYPDGREGKELAVELSVDVDIIPGSVRDMIQVTVDDATVNIFGTAIPGLEVEFQR